MNQYPWFLGEYWMSDENSTHFQFRLGGIELEISGDRDFVERMYQRVMRDIEVARKRVANQAPETPPEDVADEERKNQILWVHRCSSMMHKIYMSSPAELDKSPLMRSFETTAVNIVFADRAVFDMVLPSIEKGATLWAELTKEGRERIKAAAPQN